MDAYQSPVDIQCLATAIYSEARGESVRGQAAVAEVVILRVERQGSSVCKVVTAPGQFAGYAAARRSTPKQDEPEAWAIAEAIAGAALAGKLPETECSGRNSFYSGEPPAWAVGLPACRIGRHYFVNVKDKQ